jgi:hypothetical protein
VSRHQLRAPEGVIKPDLVVPLGPESCRHTGALCWLVKQSREGEGLVDSLQRVDEEQPFELTRPSKGRQLAWLFSGVYVGAVFLLFLLVSL